MQKIISLFQRNCDGDKLVRNEVVPGAEWVQAGEGLATVKWDGTCCILRDGVIYKRYDAKHGKAPPAGFWPTQKPDPVTGHWPGWVGVDYRNPTDQWHVEARERGVDDCGKPLKDGTYELIGPKVQGNRYRRDSHVLVRHGVEVLRDAPRDYEGIKAYLQPLVIEGIVWHHVDGRMIKIKRKDFWRQQG